MTKGFIKLSRSEETVELLKCPNTFTLLALIAYRAHRTNSFSTIDLQPGEALIGDYKSIGMTEKEYRTAKKRLKKWGLAAFKGTNKGTIARLINSRVFDINIKDKGEQNGEQRANKGRTKGEQRATNKNIKNERMKEIPPQGGNGSVLKTYPYPDWLNKTLWSDFHRMRSRIRKPIITERTITGLLNKLEKLADQGHDRDEIIQSAIDNCWLTFYPPKKPDNKEGWI